MLYNFVDSIWKSGSILLSLITRFCFHSSQRLLYLFQTLFLKHGIPLATPTLRRQHCFLFQKKIDTIHWNVPHFFFFSIFKLSQEKTIYIVCRNPLLCSWSHLLASFWQTWSFSFLSYTYILKGNENEQIKQKVSAHISNFQPHYMLFSFNLEFHPNHSVGLCPYFIPSLFLF